MIHLISHSERPEETPDLLIVLSQSMLQPETSSTRIGTIDCDDSDRPFMWDPEPIANHLRPHTMLPAETGERWKSLRRKAAAKNTQKLPYKNPDPSCIIH